MTFKEIDKKLSKIKKELYSVEKRLIMKKDKLNRPSKKADNGKFLKEWERLRDKVSSKWDKKFNAVEEIRDQREKSY